MATKGAWALAADPQIPPFLSQSREWLPQRLQNLLGGGPVVGGSGCATHSLEQAEDEGVEAHGMAGELWELADFVVEAVQGLSGWAWEEARAGGHVPHLWNPQFCLGPPA